MKTNLREDQYAAPLSLLRRIVREIRSAVPANFVVGLKLNAADYVHGGLGSADAEAHLREISEWDCIDFIEISGGDYENPGEPTVFILYPNWISERW